MSKIINLVIVSFFLFVVNARSENIIEKKNMYSFPKHSLVKKNRYDLKIGDQYEGGILFYIYPDGKKGLVVLKNNIGHMTWERAKLECMRYNNGFKNWRLPTINEFYHLYNYYDNINHWDQNKGIEGGYYWSSTEIDTNYSASVFRFSDKDFNYAKIDLQLIVLPIKEVLLGQ